VNFARAIALAVLFFFCATLPFRASTPKPMPRGFGAAIGYGLGGAAELDQLGSVWYVDYDFRGAVLDRHPRLFLVEARADLNQAFAIAKVQRGEWWQFGNEPNDPNQDNLSPAEYARRYREFYFGLKRADPSARVIAAGIADADWSWADAFRENYRAAFGRNPSIDGWSVHNYLLDHCEDATDAEKFKERLTAFRAWMARVGDADKPLLLTEYGVLYGNGCCECPAIAPDAVVDFMQRTTRWMNESRPAQSWAWFAVRTAGRFNGDLFDERGSITKFGLAYRELVHVFGCASSARCE